MKKNQLEEIYIKFAPSVFQYAYQLSKSKQVAEDLTQETFLQATIHLHTFKDESVRSWLFRVTRNAYIDEWRKKVKRQHIWFHKLLPQKEILSPYGLPEQELLGKEISQNITQLLQFLPENYRTVIYLREFEEFSYHEIMQTTELSENQVKVTLFRARKRLQQLVIKKGWYNERME
ncbi:sigma-70 family RNA polymerase sigma factor [Oceanobacillus iheyensis]|uniref:RNA polymerase ECF-type sigma factor n=1 Tax=Oceanobacillus iheyensis (strain DSM 14371 / CIP 107618 / JCM 11309 / KCTC 3954 / HTE831) TaxID=221109 RepID=Q8ERK4_OCEIH|nr:sigma-70 family RNA polymerase sigma factor [Oceanobacillus iheyensis]BAC13254.1 RNA polymerase ECF-type sigma factor [Oceanobacillus iheyensis HTE831]